MHYLRILRPPALTSDKGCWTVPVVLTINTDLSDAFLTPPAPIKLKIGVYDVDADAGGRKVPPGEIKAFRIVEWAPGSRVLKTEIRLSPGPKPPALRFFAFPSAQLWGGSSGDVVQSLQSHGQGRIMPVWADVHDGEGQPTCMACRRLRIGTEASPTYLEIEEEMGESMARHVWDGGVTMACLLLDQANPSETGVPKSAILDSLASTPIKNIVEIGCGVGTLGLAAALWRKGKSAVLLTDLPDARKRAEANISRWTAQHQDYLANPPKFEALDWDDGARSVFGPEVGSRSWDLVVLSDCTYNVDIMPALVGTLSALHELNGEHSGGGENPWETRVLLATKQRHSSEECVFRLMADDGWTIAEEETFPLPSLGADMQSVQLYLYKK